MQRDVSTYDNASLGFHSARDLHALRRERDEFKSRQRTRKPAVKQSVTAKPATPGKPTAVPVVSDADADIDFSLTLTRVRAQLLRRDL